MTWKLVGDIGYCLLGAFVLLCFFVALYGKAARHVTKCIEDAEHDNDYSRH